MSGETIDHSADKRDGVGLMESERVGGDERLTLFNGLLGELEVLFEGGPVIGCKWFVMPLSDVAGKDC